MITTRTKTVTVREKFVCDILNKEITESEVYATFGDYCVSKEAARRLPFPLLDKYLLEIMVRHWPPITTLEVLHSGVWLLGVISYYATFRGGEPGWGRFHQASLTTVEKAVLAAEELGRGIFWVFNEGRLVRHIKTKLVVVAEDRAWPPGAVVIEQKER